MTKMRLKMVVVVAAVLLLLSVLVLAVAVALVAILLTLNVATPATGIHTRRNLKNLKYISRLHENMQTVSCVSAICNWHICVKLRCDEN